MKTQEFMEEVLGRRLSRELAGWEKREGQVAMAAFIAGGLAVPEHVLVEAGTGTGKSLAYLVPVLQFITKNQTRAVVCTASINLQEQLLYKDIPLALRATGTSVDVALAKGRSHYLCRWRLEEELQSGGLWRDQLTGLCSWADQTATGDASELPGELQEAFAAVCADHICLRPHCRYQDDCFFLKARERVRRANLIVANYHLFFADLMVQAIYGEQAAILPPLEVAVFDEAHRLPEIATTCLTVSVSFPALAGVTREIRRLSTAELLGPDLEELERAAALFFGSFPWHQEPFLLPGYPLDLAARVKEKLQETGDRLEEVREHLADAAEQERVDRLVKQVRLFYDNFSFVLAPDAEYVAWAEFQQSGSNSALYLHASPILVARQLRSMVFDRLDTAILTSATLTVGGDFSYFRSLAGLDRGREGDFPSPFHYAEQCLLYFPPDLPEPNDPTYASLAYPRLADLIEAAGGRTLALFTSYQALRRAYAVCTERLDHTFRLLKQGDMPRLQLLAEFSRDVRSVLLATASFWEGVDVPGEALSCLVIDRLPFPVPTHPLEVARNQMIRREGKNPFTEDYLPRAVIRLKQGFGRLIRSQADRGVVAILDNRILTRSYGRQFLRALPSCRRTASLDEIRQFLG